MDPVPTPGQEGEKRGEAIPPLELHWQSVVPSIREHLPSVVWGAALPIAAYFLVRHHVGNDTQALLIAGGVSGAWVVFQFVRQRKIDVVGAIVLLSFALGVASSTLLGGNTYVLKVRDAFFTVTFGIACIVTVFTHERPTFFYFSRYFSAGNDPARVEAYNQLIELPRGRQTFKVLSLVWGIGLLAEGTFRMTLGEVLHTGTFLAISPFITASTIASLFAFTFVYTKRVRLPAVPLLLLPVAEPEEEAQADADSDPQPEANPNPDARVSTSATGTDRTPQSPPD
jgi:hypothetical protein